MVSVENATVVSITTYEELKSIIQRGSERRHTTGTLMNEESSRSHLILSIVIESTNLQTQSIARGKVYILSVRTIFSIDMMRATLIVKSAHAHKNNCLKIWVRVVIMLVY